MFWLSFPQNAGGFGAYVWLDVIFIEGLRKFLEFEAVSYRILHYQSMQKQLYTRYFKFS